MIGRGPDRHGEQAMLERLAHDPVLRALPVATVVTGATGLVVAWNGRAEHLFDRPASDAIGGSIFELITPPSWQRPVDLLDRVVAGDRVVAEMPLQRRDGSTFVARIVAAPVRDAGGPVVGMLALADDITEGAAAIAARADDAERLSLALEAGRLGTWEYDVVTGLMHISRRFEEVLGLQPGMFGGTYDSFLSHVHPDDRAVLAGARQVAMRHDHEIRVEYRVVRGTGEVRWIEGRGLVRVTDGSVTGSIGVVIDVTERREAQEQREALAARLGMQARAAEMLSELDVERRLAALADIIVPGLATCCAIHLADRDGIRLAAVRHTDPSLEASFTALLETFPAAPDQPYGAGAVIASGQSQLLPPVSDAVLAAAHGRREAPEELRRLELRSILAVPLISRGRALGALSLGRSGDGPWTDDDRALIEQIASTAAIALDNAQLFEAERQARAAAEANERRLALLADVTQTLARTLNVDDVLRALTKLLVPQLAEIAAVDVLDEERPRRATVHGVDTEAVEQLLAAEEIAPRRSDASSAVAHCLRTGEAVVITEVDHESLRQRAATDRRLGLYLAVDVRSAIVAPLTARGRVVGALSLYGVGATGHRYAERDAQLAVEIGRRAGLVLDNARLYSREHALAEALQRSLLPDLKALPGLDIAARYLPSSDHAQVGGDWFDAFLLDDGAVGLAVGDAMGHDPRASGAMGQLRSVLRSYAFEGAAPGVVLDKLDRLVQGFAMAQLATVFYGRMEAAAPGGERTLRYSSAGHPPPLIRRGDGSTELLDAGQSVVIGVPLEAVDRPEAVVVVPAGALVVFYTDGLVEGRHLPIDDGIARLRETVSEVPPGTTADGTCDRILNALVGDSRDDDIAVLVVRSLPAAEAGNATVAPQ